jgi:hypothetical protein
MDENDWDEWISKVCATDPIPDDPHNDSWTVTPRGPSLNVGEIDGAVDRLTKWQSTKAFSDDVMRLCGRCPSSDYFLRPRLKFLHDAFVLAEFSVKRGVDQVRLELPRERWPDGHIKIGTRIFKIEITSTHGGRKLGDEYRKVKDSELLVEDDPVEDWIARADSVPAYLDQTISDKVARNYSSPCWLVVYLNISEWGIRQKQIEQVIAGVIFRHRSQFENISVLWKGRLYSDH